MRLYDNVSDADLTHLIKTGDHVAFTELYNRYWAVLFQHAVKLLKNEDEAVDIVQDVFSTIWIKRAGLNINTSLKSYLYIAVRNKIVSIIRHHKVHEHYLDSLSGLIEKGVYETDEKVRFKEFSVQIESEIDKLPAKMKTIFELSRNQGLSHNQIAIKLQISDGTVKKQIYNALKLLKVKLDLFVFIILFIF